MSRVGVVIVNFNGGEHLGRCLDALATQTRAPDWIVVVDNCSADGSLERALARHPGVAAIRNGDNRGFAAASNQGVAWLEARGADLAALLNPDAFAQQDWLAALCAAAARAPECASFASRMMRAGEADVVDGLGDAYHFSGLPWRRYHGRPLRSEWLRAGEVFGACGGAALYRIDAFRACGGLDEAYFCYCEDVDLALRLRLAGWTCRLVPDAVVEHVGSAVTGYRSDFSTYHGQRNLVWTFVKNMPSPLFALLLPAHVVANVAALAVGLARGQLRVVWTAKRDGVKGLGRVWRERRAVQRTRRASAGAIWRALDKSLAGRA